MIKSDKVHIGISLLPSRYRHWQQELRVESPRELVISLDAFDDGIGAYIDYDGNQPTLR